MTAMTKLNFQFPHIDLLRDRRDLGQVLDAVRLGLLHATLPREKRY